MPFPVAATDENGDSFDVWLIHRSFDMLQPVCRLGLWTALLFLVGVDPLYDRLDLWSKAIAHAWLVGWHAAMAVFCGSFLLASRQRLPHASRRRTLQAFFVLSALLFTWLGVVQWAGAGDLSIVAIAQMLVAVVFSFPGAFRRWLYGLQALALSLCVVWLDGSARALLQIQFANLLVIALVAYTMDGYMRRNARDLFTQKCTVVKERQRADTVLYNALPLEIAEELKRHHRVKAQRYPAMSILFADIVDFTRFAATQTPDRVLEVLNTLFSQMDVMVDRYQVEKIKTIGDAYMVVSKTNPQALADLALSMQYLVHGFNAAQGLQLQLRMGLHCGPAIAGVIGHKRFLYDVWGDAVNLASRMESSGEAGRIHATQAMVAALSGSHDFEARGLVDIKGKGLLPTYFLLQARAQAPGLSTPPRDSIHLLT